MDLVPDGETLALNEENYQIYVEKYCQYIIETHLEQEWKALWEGFKKGSN